MKTNGCVLFAILAAGAWAGLDTRPAARVHVRYVDGAPMRFTSRLAKVLEMNFTLGFDHTEGKQAVGRMLARIAADYAVGPESAFTIRKFQGPGYGAAHGLPVPLFTLNDLREADVIVTNNVSYLSDLPSKSPEAASAFETAVLGGKSVLGFHGSGETNKGWKFLSDGFFPLDFHAHSSTVNVPVYRNGSEGNHIALQGVLDSGVGPMTVPMGVDSAGKEILLPGVPTRLVRHELHHYAMNPLTDPPYAPLTTCLLRFDPRSVATGLLPAMYRYRGGNAYSCFWKVGAGLSAYLPAGHDDSELTGVNGFDGGAGDYERYFAQMLFFLAGYKQEACGGTVDCEGLPIVDGRDHLTGETFGISSVLAGKGASRLTTPAGAAYRIEIRDLRGRLAAVRTGRGGAGPLLGGLGLPPGIYLVRARIGGGPERSLRYLVPPWRAGEGMQGRGD